VMALVVAAGVTGSGCRSAAKPAPRVAGPTRPDPLAGWVGQTRILRHRGDAGKWTVKKADLKAAGGTCDVAVEVKQARLASGIASFSFEMIGRPRTAKRGARQEKCGDDQAMIAVTVTGFDPAATAADVESALAETLQTPEAYMRSYQVAYEVPPPPKTEEAKGESTSAAARSYKVQALKKDVPLADHHLTQKAKRVFWVDAITRGGGLGRPDLPADAVHGAQRGPREARPARAAALAVRAGAEGRRPRRRERHRASGIQDLLAVK
jgi:hypothetical protein